jgi:hypothetical protein
MISQISERLWNDQKLETLSLMVHLPLYLKLDDDYAGSARILKILSGLYGFSAMLPEVEMGEKQYEQVGPAMIDNPQLKEMVERFERESDEPRLDAGDSSSDESDEIVSLPPEIEQFLTDIAQSDADSDTDDSQPRES